ncbi:MAG: aldo/keto reductase [Saprospiraceae bacterium]|nr:aldo/keto reductase [Saprospiraceae bacterium]
MEKVLLNDENSLPALGFGTYQATEEEGTRAVQMALDNGYRLIDSAAKYENEVAVGKGIKKSEVDRSEIIVTTKLWRDQLGYKTAKAAFETSLQKLNLEYIDLYLIHWPANEKNYDNWQQTNADTWRALEELQEDGKIRSIGVSNFWPEHLDALFQTARVKPAVNQIEFHPGYWQPELTQFCQEHGIVIEAWSPLGKGEVLDHAVLTEIAKNHQKSAAQVCLRWIMQHGAIPIPKSTSPKRIQENIDVFDFELSNEEMAQIDVLPQMGFSGELPNHWPDKV